MYDKTREIWLYMCIYGENVKISNWKIYNLILTDAPKPVVYMICNMKPYHIHTISIPYQLFIARLSESNNTRAQI
jgi:hypothetical protein